MYQVGTGAWTYIASSTGQQVSLGAFGGGGRFAPVPADYDGDGKADQALYQKKKGKWRFKLSTTGTTSNFTGIGGTGWLATPGDFDGDGKTDAGAYRKSTGGWRYRSSSTGVKTNLPTLGGPGYVHYLDESVFAQRVRSSSGGLSTAWRDRLASTWLVVNEHPDELAWSGMDPRLRLAAVPGLDGLVAVRPPSDVPAPAAGQADTRFHLVDASTSDTVAKMMLVIPQLNGRDLDDLHIEQRDGEEWVRFGSYLHRPLASVHVLQRGAADVVTIGPAGFAEWRAVERGAAPVEIEITTAGAWHLYDETFASGRGSAVASLRAGSGVGYLTIFGDPGQTVSVATRSPRDS